MMGVVEMWASLGLPSHSSCGDVPAELGSTEAWVRDVLEPDQLVEAKEEHLGRARLGRGTRLLMWGLRGYVVFMMIVVAYRMLTTMHSSGG